MPTPEPKPPRAPKRSAVAIRAGDLFVSRFPVKSTRDPDAGQNVDGWLPDPNGAEVAVSFAEVIDVATGVIIGAVPVCRFVVIWPDGVVTGSGRRRALLMRQFMRRLSARGFTRATHDESVAFEVAMRADPDNG